MKEKLLKGGAVTSALVYAFCWQLPLVLASLGLGSLTFSMWLIEYKWIFLLLTFALLGTAFYKTYKNRKNTGVWGIRMLYGTTVLSIGLIIYTLFFK